MSQHTTPLRDAPKDWRVAQGVTAAKIGSFFQTAKQFAIFPPIICIFRWKLLIFAPRYHIATNKSYEEPIKDSLFTTANLVFFHADGS